MAKHVTINKIIVKDIPENHEASPELTPPQEPVLIRLAYNKVLGFNIYLQSLNFAQGWARNSVFGHGIVDEVNFYC